VRLTQKSIKDTSPYSMHRGTYYLECKLLRFSKLSCEEV
jgi:hypothetical protein